MVEKFYSDEELIAFLDGEDEFISADEIRLAIESDNALAKRVSQLSIDKKLLLEAFNAVKPEPVNLPEVDVKPEGRHGSRWFGATAAAAALVLGVAIGSLISFEREPGWMEYVAAYQALYSTSTLASVEIGQDTLRSELVRVSSAINKEITLEQLNVSPDVEFKRGQILGFKGAPLIQLAFLTKTGEPLALCIIRNAAEDTETINVATMEGMSSVNWSRKGYSYLLIGGENSELVSRLAEEFRAAGV